MRRSSSSPTISRGEVLLTIALGVLLAVVTTWPLLAHLGERIPGDLVDPLAETWELNWGGSQLFRDPRHLWDANVFRPEPDGYAFSDSLLGYSFLGLLGGDGVHAALVRYNLAYLMAYALCFVGATLLAREVGASRLGAIVAGVGFAWAPWRAAHDGHLNILSSGGIALAAFLLTRGYRRGSFGCVLGGWLAAAWQLSLGFALGIWFCYALGIAALATVATWWWRGHRRVPRRVVSATSFGIAAMALVLLTVLPAYLRVLDRYPTAERTTAELDFFSAPPRSLLVAPATNRAWGARTEAERATLPWPPEQTLWPGVLVVGLAALGVALGVRGVAARLWTVVGVVAVTLLSFGTAFEKGRWTYRPLYDHLPGWSAIRTPGRLATFSSLAVAVLAALGATWLLRRLDDRRAVRACLGVALAGTVLLEGLAYLRVVPVPLPPNGWPGTTELAVHLPYRFDLDARYMFWSTEGYPPITNASTSFLPPALRDLREQLKSFPSAESLAALRELGIGKVVVHPEHLTNEWAGLLGRPYDPADVERQVVGDLVVYTLTGT